MTARTLLSLTLTTLLFSCQSYKKLHQEAIVIDTHNDVLSQVIMEGKSIEEDLRGEAHTDLTRLQQGGVDVQVFSVFCDEKFGKDTAFKYALLQIDSLQAIAQRNPERMILVNNPAQLQMAVRQHKLGTMIGVEGGHMIEDNMSYLDSLYSRGARYLTLTWNNSTSWASSAKDESAAAESRSQGGEGVPVRKGLTDFGKQIVRRMNELGMIVDVSHLGEQSFWDVMSTTTKPIIASHSCAHALCPVFRNLTDEQIRAIGQNGGVIHLNFFSGFVDPNFTKRIEQFRTTHKQFLDSLRSQKLADYEIVAEITKRYPQEFASLRPPLSLLLDHLDHIVKLAGLDHVGLGSDFDGISSTPKGLDDVTSYPLLTKALRKRGYNQQEIRKILGENFIRVFRANTIR